MKVCCDCGVEKDHSSFHKKTSNSDGLHSRCKSCTVVYRARLYKSQSEDKRKQCVDRAVVNVQRVRDKLAEHKASHPCSDCGGFFHPVAMDFDHVSDEKRGNVSRLATYGWNAVLAEIEKCELVCSNCHRVRTYNRHHDPVTEMDR